MSRLVTSVLGKIAFFLGAIAGNTLKALVPIVPMLALVWYLERRQGADMARYRRRSFMHDAAYTFLYNSGAFEMLGASLIYGVVQDELGFMRLGLLGGLPIVVVGVLYILIADALNYGVHRAEHAIPFLWRFHSVHHAPEEINFLTAYRLHPVEKLLYGVGEIVLLILLGVPPTWWLPFTLVRGFLAAVQHTELDWSYGPLYPIVVSPRYHRLHHSSDRRDFDSNYSQLFCVWDYIFGSVNPSRSEPVAFGVAGMPPERTLLGQLFGPFRRTARPTAGEERTVAPPSPRAPRKNAAAAPRS